MNPSSIGTRGLYQGSRLVLAKATMASGNKPKVRLRDSSEHAQAVSQFQTRVGDGGLTTCPRVHTYESCSTRIRAGEPVSVGEAVSYLIGSRIPALEEDRVAPTPLWPMQVCVRVLPGVLWAHRGGHRVKLKKNRPQLQNIMKHWAPLPVTNTH